MVEVKATLWKVNCMSSQLFGFGICACESHEPTTELPLEEVPSLNLPSGEFEGFISSNRFSTIVYIPLRRKVNQYGEEVAIEELRIRLLNK
jgi:hypothetical protein